MIMQDKNTMDITTSIYFGDIFSLLGMEWNDENERDLPYLVDWDAIEDRLRDTALSMLATQPMTMRIDGSGKTQGKAGEVGVLDELAEIYEGYMGNGYIDDPLAAIVDTCIKSDPETLIDAIKQAGLADAAFEAVRHKYRATVESGDMLDAAEGPLAELLSGAELAADCLRTDQVTYARCVGLGMTRDEAYELAVQCKTNLNMMYSLWGAGLLTEASWAVRDDLAEAIENATRRRQAERTHGRRR